MDRAFLVLQDVYRCLLSGAPQPMGSYELASIICSGIGGPCSGTSVSSRAESNYLGDGNRTRLRLSSHSYACQTPLTSEVNKNEILCLSLSLVETMSSSLLSRSQPEESRLYYKGVLTSSLEAMALMSKLVSLFDVQDKLLSHFAVRSAASVVLFQLHESKSFNTVWQRTCTETFQTRCPGNVMEAVLRSLTVVIKGILKGRNGYKMEALQKLFLMLDPVFSDLYSGVLSWQRGARNDGVHTTDFDLETNLTAFLHLLELLTAMRFRLPICSPSQRLVFQQAGLLLQLLHSPLQYFVKKQALLLVKVTLLQKAGEDLSLGAQQPCTEGDGLLVTDLCVLADAVSQAVRSGWLQKIPVNTKASFFGGTRVASSGACGGPDFGMLRAASLVFLKSLEYKTQDKGKEGLVLDIGSHLGMLMLFLRQHLDQSLCHPCIWVSVVFGEQDDDMIAAARTLMNLYLYQRRSDAPADAESCVRGCNPHCHFIYLLRNIAFDHSVLLDFLISTETCFLEYFVGYLKLLRDNWEDFERMCKTTEAAGSAQESNSVAGGKQPLIHPVGSVPSVSQVKPPPVPKPLVDYGSSDESGSEEQSDPLQTAQCGELVCTEAERRPVSSSDVPQDHLCPVGLCRQVIACLVELTDVVSRLERKNLFPYKPAFLLKLLKQIEEKSQVCYQ